jgi:hypothetical protein
MVQDSTTPEMQDDPELMQFLHEKVNTLVKWDLVRFFHDNPHTVDTAENIAGYTGREDVHEVTDELLSLAETNVLRVNQVSGQNIFSLSSDATVHELINRFVRACDDRQFRVKAINQVIKAMR